MGTSAAAYMGKPNCNEHLDKYLATPAKTPVTTVKIQGQWALKVGDVFEDHEDTKFPFDPLIHSGAVPTDESIPTFISTGSAKVFINGMAAARIGDPLSCGAKIVAGSKKVFFA